MPIKPVTKTIAITAGSSAGTDLSVTEEVQLYVVGTGSAVTISESWSFSADGTAQEGMVYDVMFMGGITIGANTLSFFGLSLTAEQALKKAQIRAYYDGSAWQVTYSLAAGYEIQTADIANAAITSSKVNPGAITNELLGTGAVTETKIGTGAVTTDKLGAASVTEAKLGTGAVTADKIGASAVTEAKVNNGAITADKLDTGSVVEAKIGSGAVTTDKLGGTAVTTAKIANNAVGTSQLANGAVGVAQAGGALLTEVDTIAVSAESEEQGDYKWEAPCNCTITKLGVTVQKAVAASDAWTLTGKDNSSTLITNGEISVPASTTVGTRVTVSPSANNTFTTGQILTITSNKGTAGGSGNLEITYTKTA